jgi:hypothetical protein
MNQTSDFETVEKAETDVEILGALQGIKVSQAEIAAAARRDGHSAGMALAFFRAYYEKLPEDIVHRLTKIDAEAVEHIPAATGFKLTGQSLEQFSDKFASPEAYAQVIRAANVYREKLGYGPLGPDGWPALPGEPA